MLKLRSGASLPTTAQPTVVPSKSLPSTKVTEVSTLPTQSFTAHTGLPLSQIPDLLLDGWAFEVVMAKEDNGKLFALVSLFSSEGERIGSDGDKPLEEQFQDAMKQMRMWRAKQVKKEAKK
jgi:hypothetical protein